MLIQNLKDYHVNLNSTRVQGIGISRQEVDDLVWGYSCFYPERVFENRKAVRVDSVSEVQVSLSFTEFYSVLAMNVIPLDKDFREFASGFGTATQILDKIDSLRALPFTSLQGLLESDACYPNALAVSALIHDCNGRYLLSCRTKKVGIGAGICGVSVTGQVAEDDAATFDPILHCTQREAFEELGKDLYGCQMRCTAIVAGEQKRQPAALVDIKVETPLNDLLGSCWVSQDFAFENKDLRLVLCRDLGVFLKSAQFTEIAEYQIKQAIGMV